MQPLLKKQSSTRSQDYNEKDLTLGKRTLSKDSNDSRNDKIKQKKQLLNINKRQKVQNQSSSTSQSKSKADKKNKNQSKEKDEKQICSGAQGLMLAEKFEGNIDPKGWYMSEKLDGVRCFWDGKNLYSRNGNIFYPPDWFKDLLPKDLALDGELWTKRDDFQNAVSIVKRQDKNDEWKQIIYVVYDAPQINENFSKRLEVMEKALAGNNRSNDQKKHLKFHEQIVCNGIEHLDQELEKVLKMNGEGLMLKDPESFYETKRSNKLLKVKKFDDAEAIVTGHQKGTGRCSGMLGALIVESCVDGKTFKVGSGFDDKQRQNPPKIGSKITFKHQGVTKAGIPRFPIFMRLHPGM